MISIITPLFNAGHRIKPYFDSLTAQQYDELEVIIIDDHSTDNSIKILRDLIDDYKGRILFKLLSTPVNSGPGIARNMGLEVAQGDYIAFVDGDDTIHPEFCSLLYEKAKKEDSDLCCCNLQFLDEKGKITGFGNNPHIEDGKFEGEKRQCFLTHYVSYFTTFLYKKSLLTDNNLKFATGRSAEDSMLLACALLCCKTIALVNKPLYNYWKWTPSLSMKKNDTRYVQKIESMDNLLSFCRERGCYFENKNELDFIYFKKGFLVSVFNYIANSDSPKADVLMTLSNHIKEIIPNYRKCHYIERNCKLRILDDIIRKHPRLSIIIIRIFLSLKKTML